MLPPLFSKSTRRLEVLLFGAAWISLVDGLFPSDLSIMPGKNLGSIAAARCLKNSVLSGDILTVTIPLDYPQVSGCVFLVVRKCLIFRQMGIIFSVDQRL